jgi:hypothetical protein
MMRRIGKVTIATALPLVALATAARAQLSGIPVYYNPRGGAGIGLAGDIGFPDTKAGGGTAYGVSGSLGTGSLTLTGMVGSRSFKGVSAQPSYGGNASLRLLGGGFLPAALSVQAGYGTIKAGGVRTSTIPVGLGLSFDPPAFPLKPWIAPRWEFIRAPDSTGAMVNASGFRISAGVNFDLLLGFGLHAAVDWGQVPSKLDPTKRNTLIFGVGAHFNLRPPLM